MINNWPDHYYSLIHAAITAYIASNPEILSQSAMAFQLRQMLRDCEEYYNRELNEAQPR